jgi:hypothetical protein
MQVLVFIYPLTMFYFVIILFHVATQKIGSVKGLKGFSRHFFPEFIRFEGKKLQSFPIWTTRSIYHYNIREIQKKIIALFNL